MAGLTGLSVRCHTPLWHAGIDEEQQQDEYGLCGGTGTGRGGDEKRKPRRKSCQVAGRDGRPYRMTNERFSKDLVAIS